MAKKISIKTKKRKRSRAELAMIRSYYAKRASQKQQSGQPKRDKQVQQEVVEPVKRPFKLPLRNGGRRWNIYNVPNFILNGKHDGDIHGGLVLDEDNDNVMLVQVTHSSKKGSRNNIVIRNLDSKDLDENGNLKQSYIERRLIVTYKKGKAEEGIDVRALRD